MDELATSSPSSNPLSVTRTEPDFASPVFVLEHVGDADGVHHRVRSGAQARAGP